jgi:DEAD/DEAH box helicase domain-containing protein
VDLGPDKGISVPSRADFVFYPERPKPGERPIAVFTDGYEYHADPISGNMRIGLDSAQRLALARSGKYDVWSVVWGDVYERLDQRKQPVSPLTGPPGQLLAQLLNQLGLSNVAAWIRLYQSTSFDLFLHRLTSGRDRDEWSRFSAAVLLNFLNADRRQGAAPDDVCSALKEPSLPLNWWRTEPVTGTGGAAAQPAGWLYRTFSRLDTNAFVAASMEDLQNGKRDQVMAIVRLMDDCALQAGPVWKGAWTEFLRAANILQFTQRALCVTSQALSDGLYGGLLDSHESRRVRLPNAVELLMDDVHDEIAQKIVIEAHAAGCAPPQVGFEIIDPGGAIVGLAELAWPKVKVCVMTDRQMEYEIVVGSLGWTVFTVNKLGDDLSQLLASLPQGSE